MSRLQQSSETRATKAVNVVLLDDDIPRLSNILHDQAIKQKLTCWQGRMQYSALKIKVPLYKFLTSFIDKHFLPNQTVWSIVQNIARE